MLYEAGVIMVASAGNYRADCIAIAHQVAEGEGGDGEGGDTLTVLDANGQPCNRRVKFPARYPETIAVAATDSARNITDYSIRGSEVDVVAPGGTRLQPVISTTTSQRLPVVGSTCVLGTNVNSVAAGGDDQVVVAAGSDSQVATAGGDGQVLAVASGNSQVVTAGGDDQVAAGEGGDGQVVATGEGGDCSAAAGEGGDSQIVAAGEGGDGQVLYGAGSGTSQAAAHVTGLIANLLIKNPMLTSDDVRMILYATAVDLKVSPVSQGAGLIDVYEAVDLGEIWR
jgi:hypothetical protein